MNLAVIVATGLPVLAELASAGDGFCQSCKRSWDMKGNHYMIAECRKNNGAYRRTRQDLNLCVGNFDSKLGSANNGNFGNSRQWCVQGEGLIAAGVLNPGQPE